MDERLKVIFDNFTDGDYVNAKETFREVLKDRVSDYIQDKTGLQGKIDSDDNFEDD